MSVRLVPPPAPVRPNLSDVLRVHNLSHKDVADIPDYTLELRARGGTFCFRPEQNDALHQIILHGGLVAEITMGGGKGVISMVAPVLLRQKGFTCARPLLIIPANLVDTYYREREKFSAHFKLAHDLHVITYHALSNQPEVLNTIRPDWIFCDEADLFRNTSSARARRFLKYLEHNPQCRTAFLSGTLTRKGIKDYAHFVQHALRRKAYVPLKTTDVETWGNVLDESAAPNTEDLMVFHEILPAGWEGLPTKSNQDYLTQWFKARRVSAPGSVVSHGSDVQFPLVLRKMNVQVPEVIRDALHKLETGWVRPDGEELESVFAMLMAKAQLASGVYYLWQWPLKPDGTYDKDVPWIEARAAWHKAVRQVLSWMQEGLDSPKVITRAMLTDAVPGVAWMREAHDAWQAVKHRWDPTPPVRWEWLHPFLLDSACQWAMDRLAAGEPGVIWFRHRAVGAALRARGLPVFMDAGQLFDYNVPICAASIAQHGRGKNLQDNFRYNLILEWDPSLDKMEQLLARTHRPRTDSTDMRPVYVDYYAHGPLQDLIRNTLSQAHYVDRTTGKPQKLLSAVWQGGRP